MICLIIFPLGATLDQSIWGEKRTEIPKRLIRDGHLCDQH